MLSVTDLCFLPTYYVISPLLSYGSQAILRRDLGFAHL